MLRKHSSRLATACTAATFAAIASAQQSITIQAPSDTFAVNSTATATVKTQGPFLLVSLQKHATWTSKDQSKPHHVVSYSVAIAKHNKQGRWETQRQSQQVQTAFTLAPGETRQITPTTLLVPIDGIKNLSDYWIVLTTKVIAQQSPDGYGYTHAHSEKLRLPN
jgi:hypothetical protein